MLDYQLGEPTIRSACSPRTASASSAFLMPFLPLFTGIRHLAHVLSVPPTKAWLLCATPTGLDLYIQPMPVGTYRVQSPGFPKITRTSSDELADATSPMTSTGHASTTHFHILLFHWECARGTHSFVFPDNMKIVVWLGGQDKARDSQRMLGKILTWEQLNY